MAMNCDGDVDKDDDDDDVHLERQHEAVVSQARQRSFLGKEGDSADRRRQVFLTKKERSLCRAFTAQIRNTDAPMSGHAYECGITAGNAHLMRTPHRSRRREKSVREKR